MMHNGGRKIQQIPLGFGKIVRQQSFFTTQEKFRLEAAGRKQCIAAWGGDYHTRTAYRMAPRSSAERITDLFPAALP